MVILLMFVAFYRFKNLKIQFEKQLVYLFCGKISKKRNCDRKLLQIV